MIETFTIFFIVTIAAFIGSINGLGVTFLISIFLIFIDKSDHQNHLWIPYISTTVVSIIFILSRFRIFLKNLGPILYLGIFSCAGLVLGKVFKENIDLLWLKMTFGAFIIFTTYVLSRMNFFSRLNITVFSDHHWNFTTTDNLIILLIGLVGGMLDFSLAVLIYTYLIFQKEEYNVEHLDVCAYSTLALTSFINFLFIIFTKDSTIPNYFNGTYVFAILVGAFAARAIYHLITLDYKRSLLVFALYSLGFKLLVLNYIFYRT